MRKRWRWVGVFTPNAMLCAGDARIGPFPKRWWALALPDGTLHRGGRAVIRLELEENAGVEVTSTTPDGNRIWTRKQGGVPARARLEAGGRDYELVGRAIVDDSEGEHDRRTAWRWCAGVGTADDGTPLAWNLVDGIHDAPGAGERRVWRAGVPAEVGPVEFAGDLSRVAGLEFSAWSELTENLNLLVLRSRYRQLFGTFSGELPDGSRLREGYGVMEEHDALW
jgi:uncharacterized protein DUF2804